MTGYDIPESGNLRDKVATLTAERDRLKQLLTQADDSGKRIIAGLQLLRAAVYFEINRHQDTAGLLRQEYRNALVVVIRDRVDEIFATLLEDKVEFER